MRALTMLVVGVVVVVLGNYWLNPYLPVCRLPVEYSIGTFDERFGITRDEAVSALREAEAVWERSLNRDDIFIYNEHARLSVNFVYDERQRAAEAARRANQELTVRGDANEVLIELHRQLIEAYDAHAAEYKSRLNAYETRQAAYNAEVKRYNDQGGAPPEVYETLRQTRRELDRELIAINTLSGKLNDLVDQINSVSAKGNEMIGEYNERLEDFNDSFAHGHEYTQGDYSSRQAINVYTFADRDELVLVLAHELGHALSIGHVDDPTALMYYLMKDQPDPPHLAAADESAFAEACEADFSGRLLRSIRAVYNGLIS